MWDLTIHPLSDPAFSLTHFPVGTQRPCWHNVQCPPPFGAQHPLWHTAWCDTICNSPIPLLVDVVLFGFSLSGFPSKFLKRVTRERFSHPYKECSVLLSNRCDISHLCSIFASTNVCKYSSMTFMMHLTKILYDTKATLKLKL